ncbi:hypothetical protein [Variovorax sp. OV700]|uniref:hypothetical protein n=1 Tax=Variovorax sp. OV700 TaxID=1882826 RepID=UPI000B847443|nr:hypothetical protein [Variovorax sp. OV700]
MNLHRNEERLTKPGNTGNHLDVENAQVLNSYCMKCGVTAARNDLKNLGFVPHAVEDYENTCVCTSCGTAPIDMYEWHPTYLIAVNCFSEKFGLDTAEETEAVIACAGCEAKYGASKQRLLRLVLSKRGLRAL